MNRIQVLIVILGLMLFAAVSAQATVLNLGINILYAPNSGVPTGPLNPGGPSTTNTPLVPTAPGLYDVFPGATFRVQVTATLTLPNLSDGAHSPDGGDTFGPLGTPLGIQSLSLHLVSNGPAGVLNPVAGSIATRWGQTPGFDALPQTNPTSIAAPFVNLTDLGSDGDLDPTGIGFVQSNLAWDGTFTQLPGVQNGLPVFITIYRGGYVASPLGGTNQLTFTNINGLAFVEDAAFNNSLSTELFGSIVNQSITINVLPDPASPVFLGIASIWVVGVRRTAIWKDSHRHVG